MLFIWPISCLKAVISRTHIRPAAFNSMPKNIRIKAANANGMATIILITCWKVGFLIFMIFLMVSTRLLSRHRVYRYRYTRDNLSSHIPAAARSRKNRYHGNIRTNARC